MDEPEKIMAGLTNHFENFYSRLTLKVNKTKSLIECNGSTFRLSPVGAKPKKSQRPVRTKGNNTRSHKMTSVEEKEKNRVVEVVWINQSKSDVK